MTTYMRQGRPVTTPRIYRRVPVEQRLLDRLAIDLGGELVKDSPCWLYLGPVMRNGYGTISSGGKAGRDARTVLAHRVMYRMWFGPVPAGLDVDHLCRVRRCCNPSHLEAVDRRTNLRRGREARARGVVPWSAEWRP